MNPNPDPNPNPNPDPDPDPNPDQNSIDAVSDRDFVVELSFWAALLQVH